MEIAMDWYTVLLMDGMRMEKEMRPKMGKVVEMGKSFTEEK